GGDVLKHYAIAPEVIEVVTTHHERFDGSGYPFGYRGREIPLATRICALADTLDALTSNRSYRIAATFHEAYREIFLESGCHFDPLVVDALSTIPPDLWAETIPRKPVMAFPALPPSGMDHAGIGPSPSSGF
ncbi:MAG: HD-GYP domain-containing protein, partial [Nitrospirales bacterium]